MFPHTENVQVLYYMPVKLVEKDCHKKLQGRPLSMITYGGSGISTSKFECNVCRHVWNTTFSHVHRGSGCPKCAVKIKNKRLSLTEEECILRLSGRSIELVEYIGNAKLKSKFKCKVCNHVWKATFSNIDNNNKGCPNCNILFRTTLTEKHISVVKGKNISIINYSGNLSLDKSLLKCKVCNHVWGNHITAIVCNKGCPKCGGTLKLSEDECLNKLKGRSLSMLFYDGTARSSKSTFKCSVCLHIWNSSFKDISEGHGCPACAKGGFNPAKPAWVYVLHINTVHGDCYGFGITNELNDRMSRHRRSLGIMLNQEYEPLYFDSGVEAQLLEAEWKKSPYIINIRIEGFRTECVLINNETTKMIFNLTC